MLFSACVVAALATTAVCGEPEGPDIAERARQTTAAANATSVEGSAWLRGDVDTRFALVAKHLRGFDMAMVEVGYRYTELYWASRDRNFDYAAYHLGKIETAVANGVERRPRRAASAQMLADAILQVRSAIDKRDGPALEGALGSLTATCNACHRAEEVPFITVAPPTVRAVPVRVDAAGAEQREGAVQ
jgi:hypothetical protein